MENLLNYAIQVNLLLSIVYLGYRVWLKGLTFYALNRMYFLTGILFSFAYPFMDVSAWLTKPIPMIGDYITYIPNAVSAVDQGIDLLTILVGILAIGAVVLGMKFLLQLGSLVRIHFYSRPARWRDYLFRNVWIPIVPFSFMNRIYVNMNLHREIELLDIFHHEEIHVKGKHTLDILIGEAALILCWYNPFVWIMRKSIRQNLEFLTDQQVLRQGVDKQTYQYSLLHVTKQGTAIGLGNQFNFKTLKLRIMMMNKRRSSNLQLSKYAFMLPVLIFTAGALTVNKAEAKIENMVSIARETVLDVNRPVIQQDTVKNVKVQFTDRKIEAVNLEKEGGRGEKQKVNLSELPSDKQPLYFLDGKPIDVHVLNAIQPDRIAEIGVLKDKAAMDAYGPAAVNGVILVTLKESASSTITSVAVDSLSNTQPAGGITGVRIRTKTDTTKSASLFHVNEDAGRPPLYVIDGVVKKYIDHIDPNSIESVSVLKNGAATSIYGEKGRNGVIIITTKSGGKAKTVEAVESESTSVTQENKLQTVTVTGYRKTEGESSNTIRIKE